MAKRTASAGKVSPVDKVMVLGKGTVTSGDSTSVVMEVTWALV